MNTAVNLVSGPEQTRSEGGIGASQAAAAIGVSEYRTPVDEWLVVTGRAPAFEGNEATEWGHILEPVIRAKYVTKNSVSVYVPPSSIWHADLPWLKATPDGIVIADGCWQHVGPQVKNVGLRQSFAWTDGVPTDYLIQGVVEMAVTDLPRIDFAVLIGGQEYREFTVHRDAELEATVLEGLEAFWHLVTTDTQPEVDASARLKTHLLGQMRKRGTCTAGPIDAATIARWRQVVVQMAALKSEEKVLKNRVLAAMVGADAARMSSELGPISIGNPKRKVAWKAIAEDLRPLLATMRTLDRELAKLADDLGGPALAEKVEGLRVQLQLVDSLHDYEALVARHTAMGEASINRPRNWTKDVGSDADEED